LVALAYSHLTAAALAAFGAVVFAVVAIAIIMVFGVVSASALFPSSQ
jgi:hypothetical protein